ncbi:hypothetical protein BG004_004284 [Podila humilis]|nr:hypothetical protein BG004_004284 [Podila humilis]
MNVLNQAVVGVGMMPQQGTILPGTTIQLGKYTVVIDRYIAEGGFAHVYVANLVGHSFPVVVKRIAAPDKDRLAIVNSEIETMKRLGKHKNIVEYMDSCMGKLEGGGYEVLILMEYCGGGPVIDLMNRRLQNRLNEPEILKIFSNVCEAVAYMHYLDPPILHRDIKVENIILHNNDYKLCDFGSATTNVLRGDNIPRNVKDIQLLEEEINNHTTLQYRAPEMIDLYMRKGIDEKIDIWALGVLLYKLCYYTTPFEEQGQLAILNARYIIPEYPVFSPALIGLFQSMLKEDPRQRPNIYQVMKATSALRGLACPIHNIYPDASFVASSADTQSSATANILSSAAMSRPMDVLPSIEPMRRGRPTRSPATHTPSTHTPSMPFSDAAFPAPTLNFSAGFDDSFGQFTQSADPASQFTEIGSNDAFDFGSKSLNSSQSTVQNQNQSHSQLSETGFKLDFDGATAADGFKFSKNAEHGAHSSSTGPRPPSFSSRDLLHFESSNDRVPTQPSGGFNPPTTISTSKVTANDLFFGSSADIKLSNDYNSRSGTPSSLGSSPQVTIGLSSSQSAVSPQSSNMSKPLLDSKQVSQQSSHVTSPVSRGNNTGGYQEYNLANNRDLNLTETGKSQYGSPVAVSSALSAGTKTKNSAVDPLSAKMANFELLQRQQMEQLGRFSTESQHAGQNAQGKAKTLDSSRTLDGMRSMGLNGRTGASPLPTSPLVSTPSAYSRSVSTVSPNPLSSTAPAASYGLDRTQLARRDLEAEKKLIEQQQKEFEKQQLDLAKQQLAQLEEQQRLHRLQQEQLQKAQQEQIQRQHQKWQERKRMIQEQDQLAHAQAAQQKDLEYQHQSQQLEQQQQQQQQQQDLLPTTFGLSTSLATASLNDPAPSVPLKSVWRSGAPASTSSANGVTTSKIATVTTTTAPTNTAMAAALARSRRVSVNGAPGPKPELLPKPTRFRMKDGTGTVMAGEEEAFRRKFPSTLEDDILFSHTQISSPSASSSSSSGYTGVISSSSKPQSHNATDPVNIHVPIRKESVESFSGSDVSLSLSSPAGGRLNQLQYRSPSQRARELRGEMTPPGKSTNGSRYDNDEDDDDGEERLIRTRPAARQQMYRQQQQEQQLEQQKLQQQWSEMSTAIVTSPDAREEGSEEGLSGPAESVRERVQRMNRVGRVV